MPKVLFRTLAYQIRTLAHHLRTGRQSISCLHGVWDFDASLQAKAPIPPAEDCRRIAAELLQLRAQ
eukprot:1687572-Pleurochrysis_carterae.AAC.1